MKRVEWNIPANVWSGLNTKYDPTTKMVGVDDFISGSVNYDLSPTGNIIKRPKTNLYNPTPLSHPIKDEYEMIFASGTRHKLVMSNGSLYYTVGDGVFNLVQAGYVAQGNMEFAGMNDLVYFGNGIDDPQVYDMGVSYGGVSYTPPTVADAGVTAPSTAPTFAADTAGGAVPAGAHTYKVTFLYRDTQESNGGPASAVHTVVNPNNTVNLTALPIGGLGVTARKIYRDNNDGNWLLVQTVANNTATTASDTAALGTLPIPSDNNAPPKWSLVTQFRDRLWVAGVADAQSTLYYSDAGLPDVWPTNNFIGCNQRDTITGIVPFNDKITVFNKSSFGIILGTTSDDFRYIDVSPNIGCVDNRSIQIVTVNGVPKLQWLSAFGMYQWDGSNIELISDKIEDLLRFNIQQSQGAFNRNIQTAPNDFLAGTSTPGINLTNIPGSVTTDGYMKAGEPSTLTTQPSKVWDSQPEWEGGSSKVNVATLDGTNTIKAVTDFLPTISQCSLSGLNITGSPTDLTSTVSTPVAPNYTGETKLASGQSTPTGFSIVAQPITFPRGGTINQATFRLTAAGDGGNKQIKIWADASGVPGAVVFAGFTSFSFNSPGGYDYSEPGGSNAINTPISAGKYWIGIELTFSAVTRVQVRSRNDGFFTNSLSTPPLGKTGAFGTFSSGGGATATALQMSFTFTQTEVVSASGTMTTPVYDSLSLYASGEPIQVATNPSPSRVLTTLYAADDAFMSVNVTTQVFDTNVGGAFFPFSPMTNKRYWRFVTVVSTTDDRVTATARTPNLNFTPLGTITWVSEAIDHTTDITTLDSLLLVSNTPAGTSVTVEIATSSDNLSYSSFTAVGLATPLRYSKVQVTLNRTTDHLTSPSASLVQLNWTLISTLISYAINTVATPTQWGLFQSDFVTNTGTVVFQTRSAATEGGLTAASWTTVTNGSLIPSAVNPWIQWRVTITSSVNQVPEIRSVIINWLLVANTGIRVASMFYNQTYFMAAAETNSLHNNIVLYYDKEGRWGQYTGLTINTMGTLYGQAYYGDALVGNYVQWLNATITNNDTVGTDIRSKAFSSELVSSDRTKALRHMIVECENTLATITPLYSTDEGQTWLPMVDVVTGLPSFTGSGTTKIMHIRFVPAAETIVWGYSIICRITNNDQYPLNIAGLRAMAFVSERPVLTR